MIEQDPRITQGPTFFQSLYAWMKRVAVELNAKAPLNSPTLTGDPTAPTPPVTDDDTSIATTAWVRLLIGDVWSTASITPTAGSGSFTSASAALRYKLIGKTVFFDLVVTITTNGTAAGSILVTLPWAAKAESSFAGRESQATGALCGSTIGGGSNQLGIFKYDNTYPGGSGYRIALCGVMEVA